MKWHEPNERYHVPIKRCEVTIHFADGTHITDVLNMILQDGTERVIDYVEVDGETLSKKRTCEVVTTLHWDCYHENDFYTHEFTCGHIVTSDDKEPPNYCPDCGAKVTDG